MPWQNRLTPLFGKATFSQHPIIMCHTQPLWIAVPNTARWSPMTILATTMTSVRSFIPIWLATPRDAMLEIGRMCRVRPPFLGLVMCTLIQVRDVHHLFSENCCTSSNLNRLFNSWHWCVVQCQLTTNGCCYLDILHSHHWRLECHGCWNSAWCMQNNGNTFQQLLPTWARDNFSTF